MNILMLLEKPFPFDIRVQKEANALIGAGHEVYLLCPLRNGQKTSEDINGLKIIRFNGKQPNGFFRRKLLLGYQGLTFRDPIWLNAIIKTMQAFKVDIIHVHDLFLVATAVAAKKKTGIPVVADLHENFSELLRIRFKPNSLSWKDRLLVGADRWAKHEPRILENVDHIIVVVEEAMERLISLGVSSEKISIVSNTESYGFWKFYKVDDTVISRYQNSFVVSYIGGFQPHRGLDTAIEAMSLLPAEGSSVKLALIGGDGWYAEKLKQMAKDYGVEDKVDFVPLMPIEKVRTYLEASNIGIVPHYSTPHTEATVPHKLFQYMLFEKPLIVSSCKPLKRIVKETDSGLVFRAGDPADASKKIISLYNRPEVCRSMGKRGKKAATRGKYNWTYDANILINFYNEFIN